MKILLIASFSLLALNVFAVDESLSSMKSNANSSISKKMSVLGERKNCINDATTVEAFRACRYDADWTPAQKMEDENMMEKKYDESKEMIKSKTKSKNSY